MPNLWLSAKCLISLMSSIKLKKKVNFKNVFLTCHFKLFERLHQSSRLFAA